MLGVIEQLLAALRRLGSSAVWREMLAENSPYGGCELFFHRSLLWAFNSVPSRRYYTTVEKKVWPLQGNCEIDLLIYKNEPKLVDLMGTKRTPEEYLEY